MAFYASIFSYSGYCLEINEHNVVADADLTRGFKDAY